jgi:hypothetical protein
MALTSHAGLFSGRSAGFGRIANIRPIFGNSVAPTTANPCSPILGTMRISGAFLAEKTAAVANKLDVTGGVISKYKVGRDRTAQFDIVVLTQGDTGGADRLVVVEVTPPEGGQPLHMHRELPMSLMDGEVGFACFQFKLTLNVNGRWTIGMKGAAGEVSLPLTVSGPLPRNGR